MLSTYEILNILKDVSWFKGVFPIDMLPVTMERNTAIIINLDVSYERGSHWVALYLDVNRFAHYFDSFGREPMGLILNFIERISYGYAYNPVKIQDNLSVACGYFCLLFVISVKRLKDFYILFNKCAHIENEKTLFKQMKKYLLKDN